MSKKLIFIRRDHHLLCKGDYKGILLPQILQVVNLEYLGECAGSNQTEMETTDQDYSSTCAYDERRSRGFIT